jgi:hypothetical protein
MPQGERHGNEMLWVSKGGYKQLRKKNFQAISGGYPHDA